MKQHSSYFSKYAKIYDKVEGRNIEDECRFLDKLFRKYNVKKVIDPMCGTGAHVLALDKLGYDVTGSDRSRKMIAEARRKAGLLNSKVKFSVKDCRKLNLVGFGAAICLFYSLQYLFSNKKKEEFIKTISKCLNKNGILILEIANTNYWEKIKSRTLAEKGTTTYFSFDRKTMKMRMNQTSKNKKILNPLSKILMIEKLISLKDMKRILKNSGFKIVSMFSDFSGRKFKENNNQCAIVVCRKK